MASLDGNQSTKLQASNHKQIGMTKEEMTKTGMRQLYSVIGASNLFGQLRFVI
jgi:hypothetical protein